MAYRLWKSITAEEGTTPNPHGRDTPPTESRGTTTGESGKKKNYAPHHPDLVMNLDGSRQSIPREEIKQIAEHTAHLTVTDQLEKEFTAPYHIGNMGVIATRPGDTTRDDQYRATSKSGKNKTSGHYPTAISNQDRSWEDVKRLKDNNAHLTEELKKMKADLQRTVEELNTERVKRVERDAEVVGMREYAIADDDRQGEDVVSLIEQINTSVDTFAFGICSDLDWKAKGEGAPYREKRTLPFLLDALGKCDPENPNAEILLQTAIQSFLLRIASEIMYQACHETDQEVGFIQGVERHVQESETQAVFGRWRVLTYRALLAKAPHREELLLNRYLPNVVKTLCFYRLLLTGYDSWTPSDRENVRTRTEEIMKDLISKSIRFIGMVRTKIVSVNYQDYLPEEGAAYDEGWMEAEAGSDETGDSKVVAIVKMGLSSSEKILRSGVTKRVVLKAGVFLKSEVLAILDEGETPSQDNRLPVGFSNDRQAENRNRGSS